MSLSRITGHSSSVHHVVRQISSDAINASRWVIDTNATSADSSDHKGVFACDFMALHLLISHFSCAYRRCTCPLIT